MTVYLPEDSVPADICLSLMMFVIMLFICFICVFYMFLFKFIGEMMFNTTSLVFSELLASARTIVIVFKRSRFVRVIKRSYLITRLCIPRK